MKKVLVTGATGFIGRHSLDKLVRRGYDVHAVTSRNTSVRKEGVTFHTANLLNNSDILSLMKELAPTDLLHFAWYAEPGKYWEAKENFTWVKASISLIEAFHENGGKRVVYAGSCAEYDWSQITSKVSENSPCKGNSSYAACKNALYQMMTAYSKTAGISFAWGRIFHLFGSYEHPDRLIPYVIRCLFEQSDVECTEGVQLRDFMDVRDVASAFVALLDSLVEGAVNIASGNSIELRDLVSRIQNRIESTGVIKLGARQTPANEPAILVADTTRLNKEVDWYPDRSIDQGLEDTVRWWNTRQRIKE